MLKAPCSCSRRCLLLPASECRALLCMGAGSRAPPGLSSPHSTPVPLSGRAALTHPGSAHLVQLPSAATASLVLGLHHDPRLTTACPAQQALPTICTALPAMASLLPQLPALCLVTAAASALLVSIPSPASSISIQALPHLSPSQPCLSQLQPSFASPCSIPPFPCLSPSLGQHGLQ